jgi:parallel beta-helix repeat protein
MSLALLVIAAASAATVHTVDPLGVCAGNPNCHTTIGAAVTAAGNGDTINVWAGTYNENIIVAGFDDLHLVGADTTQATLLGALDLGVGGAVTPPTAVVNGGAIGTCVDVQSSRDVSVIGLRLTNCPVGVNISTSTDTVVEGNWISGAVAIGIADTVTTFSSRITGNRVTGASSIGILLRSSENGYVADNHVQSCPSGVYVSNTFRSQVVNNRVAMGSGVGITVIGALESRIERNSVNGYTGGNLYITSTSTDTSWVGNRLLGSWTDLGVGSASWDNL